MVYGKIILKNILHDYDTENYSYINSFNNLSIFNEKNNSFSSFIDSKIAYCETISKEINRIKFLKNMFKSITKKAISNSMKLLKGLAKKSVTGFLRFLGLEPKVDYTIRF